MTNVKNLLQVVNHILEHPETWYQKNWHCGTTHCIAGHAQIMSGKEECGEEAAQEAQDWLGLSGEDAAWLFSACRTISEIYAFAKSEAAGIPYFNKEGFNKEGFNCNGFDKAVFDSDRFDSDGFDCDGFNCNGFDSDGFNKAGLDEYGFDKGGFDDCGFNKDGNRRPLLVEGEIK